MLEKLPSGLGHALHGFRAGLGKLAVNDLTATGVPSLDVTSPAFSEGGAIPARYTADGAKLSPALEWSGVPAGTAALILLMEDADSPTPQPLVHAIVLDLPPGETRLVEGALPGPAGGDASRAMGRNSYFMTRYLPPDPPPGHGAHRYAFELFALDAAPSFKNPPGRRELTEAMRGHILAKGCLIGVYERS
jgi:Raf kinase inhibitor-like YbhB/YbcL family protein